jgi:hypothetical protein
MLLRWLCVFMSFGVAGCAEQAWHSKEYVNVAATHGKHSRGANPSYFVEVLDGVAHLLYANGFLFETNGSDFQPKKVFSESSSFKPHYSGTTGKRLSGAFTMQTTFIIIESPTSEIRCVSQYSSEKEVWFSFDQSHVTSAAKPTFFIRPERKSQVARLADQIAAYMRTKLPGYQVVVSVSQQWPNQALERTASAE